MFCTNSSERASVGLVENIGLAQQRLVMAARHDIGLDRPGVLHNVFARLARWPAARRVAMDALRRSDAKPEAEREIG